MIDIITNVYNYLFRSKLFEDEGFLLPKTGEVAVKSMTPL